MDNKELDVQDVLKQEFITVQKAINSAYRTGHYECIPGLVSASVKISNTFSVNSLLISKEISKASTRSN